MPPCGKIPISQSSWPTWTPCGGHDLGVTHISHIFVHNIFASFELKARCGVTNKFFFKYLLLCHAIQAQFAGLTRSSRYHLLEVLLSYPDIEKLVMTVYSPFRSAGVNPFQLAQRKWEVLISVLSEEVWEEASEICFQNLL